MQKKGQVTLFIVVALILVVVLSVVFIIKPKALAGFLPGDEAADVYEECLADKLKFAVLSNDFISQPHILLAKSYLESYMDNAALQCSSVFSDLNGLDVEKDDSKIKSTIYFDSNEFKSLTSVDVKVSYPIAIKKGDKKRYIDEFRAGVRL